MAELGPLPPPDELPARLAALREKYRLDADDAPHDVEARRIRWLGRKSGYVAQLNDNWLNAAPPERKREVGMALNELRAWLEAQFEAPAPVPLTGATPADRVDVTLPGRLAPHAPLHPVAQAMAEMVGIFTRLGYSVAEGPEIETPYYNFEALNIPADHPARDDQDTLYLEPAGWLLRSHTSPVQIRAMESGPPPLRIVAPGRVYRRDAPDASHSPMFHQLEGLAVDERLSLRDLKGTLDHFAREMFGPDARTRFRPSYFQFTEPSAEMDVSCIFCGGAGCRACKQTGWIEIMGCGMVNPAVYRFVKYDPDRYSGFAFGMGVERIAMIRYGIDDLQRFFSGDLRFLEQFR